MKYLHVILLLVFSLSLIADTTPNIVPSSNIIQILDDYFNNLKSFKASFLQQSQERENNKSKKRKNNKIEKCEGTINISKNQKKPKMEIKYKNGRIKEIYMEGRYILIVNRETNKKKTYSIITTPLYALLSGNMTLSKLKPNIIIHKDDITININSNNQNITIVLSIRKSRNNKFTIKKLLAWTIEDNNTIINVGFDSKNYFVNGKQIVEDIDTNKNVQN